MAAPKTVLERKAVYNVVGLGSLYNLHKDQVVNQLDDKSSNTEKLKISKCKIIYGRATESENFLQMIGVQDDLRLSILLNLVSRTGLVAIIDYPLPIDGYTRFLHYTYIRKIQNLNNRQMTSKEAQLAKLSLDATHLITSITWGIEFIVVLQLPHVNETADQIDAVLNNISSNLNGTDRIRKPLTLTQTEQDVLQRISHTKIYSKTPRLADMETIREIYHEIHLLQGNKPGHRPIDFKLHFIPRINSISHINDDTLTARHKTCKKDAEDYLLQLSKSINYLKLFFSRTDSQLLYKHLKEKRSEVNTRYSVVEKQYKEEIKRWEKFIVGWRKNEISITQIEHILNDEQQQTLQRNMDKLIDDVKGLEAKEEFINDLQQKHFDYYNVTTDDVETVFQTFIKGGQYDRVLCSSDQLNTNKPSEFDRLRDQLFEEHQSNSVLRLLYADFSSCSFKLPDLTILPKDNTSNVMNPPITTATSTEESINILLLGESGVGKSTFINAFVNYLTFTTLKDAESQKPVVTIPVSFMITAGDNFVEHVVKFGDFDESNNEDFDHPGQSVTQHCKSHPIDLTRLHGKNLRIIDTPGFEDTRGLDQDDLNMQHILEYVSHIGHIHAVCFLLKPNASRLTNFLRTSVIQLCDLLGPNARQNIVFCFTNARTTFYTPGDTAPLLRAMLNSFPSKDIPFAKKNTFCFDNESFRYLVALQNAVTFNELDRNEYENSWSISVKESIRFLDYVRDQLPACPIDDRWKSVKQEIVSLIQPMLQAIRNTLQSIISSKNDDKRQLNGFSPTTINQPTSSMSSYKHPADQCNRLSLQAKESSRDYRGRRISCECNNNQQISPNDIPANHDTEQMESQVSKLFRACIEFAQFLIHSNHCSTKDDPFLIGLIQIIDEQKTISSNNNTESFNKKLLEELEKRKTKYERGMSKIQANSTNIDLQVISDRIKSIKKSLRISEQMIAANYHESKEPDSLTAESNKESTCF